MNMGRLILQMGITLDGLVARPGKYGAGGWGTPPEDSALKQRKLELIRSAQAHLMGRNTYEEMAEFWPVSDDEYAEPMNTIPKVVFSTSLQRASWRETRIARGELSAEIGQLKQQATGNLIAWGGASFAQSLSRLGLIDEYRLVLHPVALGSGLPLFKGLTSPLHLTLVEAQPYSSGLTLLVYQPLDKTHTGS
jgi:dihydrofolate reductase